MSQTRRLILENQLGQKVRSFALEAEDAALIYRHDNRRVELHTDLSDLDEAEIGYDVLKKISLASLTKGVALAGVGRLRLAAENEKLDTPTYLLPSDQDEEKKLLVYLKKSAIGHVASVAALVLLSIAVGYFTQKQDEPQLVTIHVPEKKPTQPRERVQVSETKIKQVKTRARVVNRPVPKPKVVTHKPVVRPKSNQRRAHQVVRNAPTRSLERVGALAALGGVKNGSRNHEGLDSKSMKAIRSAGVGSGGGGVGDTGSGGVRGMMPGSGLIAGSRGSGGRAESAGGYGTRGSGGGKAGYGKISLVGGTSGVTLPLEEEALVQGGLDRDQIAAVINRHRGQIIYCYEQGLQADPALRGRVSVEFVIGPAGRITTARVAQSSLGSRTVEGCMIAKMKNWQFPRPVGNVNVDVLYPFELRRVSSR